MPSTPSAASARAHFARGALDPADRGAALARERRNRWRCCVWSATGRAPGAAFRRPARRARPARKLIAENADIRGLAGRIGFAKHQSQPSPLRVRNAFLSYLAIEAKSIIGTHLSVYRVPPAPRMGRDSDTPGRTGRGLQCRADQPSGHQGPRALRIEHWPIDAPGPTPQRTRPTTKRACPHPSAPGVSPRRFSSRSRCASHAMRALVVGAYLRLREAHPRITQKRFCQTLAVPVRTLRSWLEKQPVSDIRSISVREYAPLRQTRPPRQRRKRFGFALTVPDTQMAADTTDLRAFGVPLKLVATQDVGGRDQDLLDAVIVDDRESADHVVAVLTESLTGSPRRPAPDRPGNPVSGCTDPRCHRCARGRARRTEGRRPSRQGHHRTRLRHGQIALPPRCSSSPIAWPATFGCLAQPELAIAATTLLLTALLRAYQAGARASPSRPRRAPRRPRSNSLRARRAKPRASPRR